MTECYLDKVSAALCSSWSGCGVSLDPERGLLKTAVWAKAMWSIPSRVPKISSAWDSTLWLCWYIMKGKEAPPELDSELDSRSNRTMSSCAADWRGSLVSFTSKKMLSSCRKSLMPSEFNLSGNLSINMYLGFVGTGLLYFVTRWLDVNHHTIWQLPNHNEFTRAQTRL